MMEDFVGIISRRYGICREDIEALLVHAEEVQIAKGEHLVEYGGFNDSLYFVRDGILRAFRSPEDTDLTLWFALPGDIVVDMFCYYGGVKSPIGIEAEIDTTAYVMDKMAIEQTCESSIHAANAVRRIFERHSFVFEENVLSLWNCADGRERYLSILERHPELLRSVPLKRLASYLKITPQSLSRIRAGLLPDRG